MTSSLPHNEAPDAAAEPPHDPPSGPSYTDRHLLDVLGSVKTIAMVGASSKVTRPSFFVLNYLISKGYRVIPVNPGQAGSQVLNETFVASLAEARASAEAAGTGIDMVDVFRRPEDAPGIAREAIEIGAKVLWLQIGVISEEARRIAEEAGLTVIMNHCPKIEYQRLHGEISRGGMNSRIITARKRQLSRRTKKLM